MSAPWVFALDARGPCNGDVLVETSKGKLVAVIFSTGDDDRTMARARAFCRAVSPQHCCHCGKDVPEGSGQECEGCREVLEEGFKLLDAVQAQVGDVRDVLKPFADLAEWLAANKPGYGDGDEVQIEGWPYTLSVDQLRRAEQLYKSLPQ